MTKSGPNGNFCLMTGEGNHLIGLFLDGVGQVWNLGISNLGPFGNHIRFLCKAIKMCCLLFFIT